MWLRTFLSPPPSGSFPDYADVEYAPLGHPEVAQQKAAKMVRSDASSG